MRVLRFFDPARAGFVGRMARLVAALALASCCALAATAGVAWRGERVRYGTAFMLSEMNLPAASLAVSRDLVRDHPASSWDYYRLEAKSLRRLGRIDESLAVYDAATAARPDWWWAHSHRCFYHALYGDPRAVMDSCERQVELDPDQPDVAYDRRAIARALTGDREGAIADLVRALSYMRDLRAEDRRIPLREGWLETLRAGGDPFTQAVLAEERTHY